MKSNKKYLFDVDVAVGIAIALVVYGHLLFNVKDLAWFVESRRLIYRFHMPLFMFLSGLLMSYSYKPVESLKMYGEFLKKKLKKFVPPYLLFSFIFLLFDYLFYGLNSSDLLETVKATFIYPAEGSAGFLWYVYVLFEFYLVLPLLMLVAKKYSLVLLTFAIALHFFNVTHLFNLNMFAFYLLFITLGIIANKYLSIYYKVLSKLGFIFVAIFVAVLYVAFTEYYKIPKVITGLCSIPAIHFIAIKITTTKMGKELAYLGRYSFYIYLMNTLVMGALFIAFTKGLGIDNLALISPVLFIAGAYIPIFIYIKIVKRVSILKILIP
ncbi:acyltransferase family protein [Winogradskyella ouciana]|uniref:acyltransferase family protein n=1 Tax=Winogradskyella ouciana TaxID=2608631 RepID=UPI003D287998